MLLMANRNASFFIALFFISQLFRDNASQQCGASGDLYSIYQMMLKGHTYKTFKTAPGTPECREACLADVRCQSYNVVMFIAICELNNRTKEARPEDFVTNKDRYYMAKGPKRGDRKCKDFKAVLQLRRGGVINYNNVRGTYKAFKTLHPKRFLQLSYNRNDKN